MGGEAKAKDIASVIKDLHLTDKKHHDLQKAAKRYSDTLVALERDAAEMSRDTEAIVLLFKEMYHRLDSHIAKGDKERKHRMKEQANLEKLAAAEAPLEEEEETESEEEEEVPAFGGN